jgi:hypothetical protein
LSLTSAGSSVIDIVCVRLSGVGVILVPDVEHEN